VRISNLIAIKDNDQQDVLENVPTNGFSKNNQAK
jgi:hypothetical protein